MSQFFYSDISSFFIDHITIVRQIKYLLQSFIGKYNTKPSKKNR